MNSVLAVLTTLVGPTQLGGWVRAAVASGLTLVAAKYLPSTAGFDPASLITDIAAVASTVVVGLWSSLGKTVVATPVAPVSVAPVPVPVP